MKDKKLSPAFLMPLFGFLLWFFAQRLQFFVSIFLPTDYPLLSIFINIFIEESLKLVFVLLSSFILAKLSMPHKTALLAIIAACTFASAENLGYLIAFPDSAVFLRLLYSTPIHCISTVLFVLAAFKKPGGKTIHKIAIAFAIAFLWHSLFNIGAWYLPAKWIVIPASILNTLALSFLFFLTEKTFVSGGYLHGRI